ncbi:MAG: hypothetical protein HY508_14070 [Acidobacteria bacterium]|nr:hypothetical protein [Acidobacteriota bacterium]
MRKRFGKSQLTFLALMGAVLFLASCEEKTINQIMADPQKYANREVGIRGKVVKSYSVMGNGVYQVDDGTGKLWVVSKTGVPREGARVAVRGKIRDGYNFGDLGSVLKIPDPIRSGLVMIESKHKATD